MHEGKVQQTRLADELAADLADAVGALRNAVQGIVDHLHHLVPRIDLLQVLETHERIGTVIVLAAVVVGLLQSGRLERGGLSQGLLAEDDEALIDVIRRVKAL